MADLIDRAEMNKPDTWYALKNGEFELCKSGFHFCKSVADCYNNNAMKDGTRICEVEASGDIKTDDNIKFVTDSLTIVAEVTEDWKRKGNVTASSTGYCNAGNWNTGDFNTGDFNTGYWNTGDFNTGDFNTGDWNTGYFNTGNWNTGYFNTGNWNTGNWNTGNYSSGCFCTIEQEMLLFDEPSGMTLMQFRNTDVYRVLSQMPTAYNDTKWNDKKNTLDVVKYDADRQKWYDELRVSDKKLIKAMPNFNADKFMKCTGINVEVGE